MIKGTATITGTTADGNFVASCLVTTLIYPLQSISFSSSSYTVVPNDTIGTTIIYQPDNATNKAVTYTSSNTSVATVDTNGVIKGVSLGTCTITATSQDGGFTTQTVVNCRIPVTDFACENFLTLAIGSQIKLMPIVTPASSISSGITFTSSNTAIATVNKKGKVNGVSKGSAVISVSSNDGLFSQNYNVNVYSVVSSITLDKPVVYLQNAGSTVKVTPTFKPTDAEDTRLSWTSSNTNIATVDSNGNITCGSTLGSCSITATSLDTGVTGSVKFFNEISNTFADAIQIADNAVISEAINPAGDFDYYKFTATKTGYYAISSSSSVGIDLTCTLFDSTENQLAYSDDEGGNAQFLISSYKCTAGVTYYLFVKAHNVASTGNYTLTIQQPVSVTGISLAQSSITVVQGTRFTIGYTIVPSNATNKNVSITSSNYNVYIDTTTGQIGALSTGTVQLTYTTKDGNISAVCTVTIT